MKKIATLIAAAAFLGTFGVSQADAAALSKRAAVRALDRELRASYDMSGADIDCKRLTKRKMRCGFRGLTDQDVIDGNVAGHRGLAYVTKYRFGVDVRIARYKKA